MNADRAATEAMELALKIAPFFAGHAREVQSAALADLLATWVAGHSPAVREQVLTGHIDCVRKLIPPNARLIADKYGLKNWSSQ
jgi:hypothetical protein